MVGRVREVANAFLAIVKEGKVLDRFRHEFAKFDNSSTVIRFRAENPIPKEIIEKLVRARMAEIEESSRK